MARQLEEDPRETGFVTGQVSEPLLTDGIEPGQRRDIVDMKLRPRQSRPDVDVEERAWACPLVARGSDACPLPTLWTAGAAARCVHEARKRTIFRRDRLGVERPASESRRAAQYEMQRNAGRAVPSAPAPTQRCRVPAPFQPPGCQRPGTASRFEVKQSYEPRAA